MLLPLALSHVLAAVVLNATNLALSIHVSVARRVGTRSRTTVAQLGVTRHRIACSLAQVAWTANAQTKHFAFHIHRATKLNHLCAELALKMPRPANALAHQVAVVNVLSVNHASPVRHAE